VGEPVEFLGDGWVAAYRAACAGLPPRAGASARLQVVVSGAPGGQVVWWADFADGQVVDAGRGGPVLDDGDPVPGGRPLVALTEPRALAVALARGEVDLSAAFMRGAAKTAGDQGALLRLLAVTATPAYRSATAALAERTSF
jgi:hypothetical protein